MAYEFTFIYEYNAKLILYFGRRNLFIKRYLCEDCLGGVIHGVQYFSHKNTRRFNAPY